MWFKKNKVVITESPDELKRKERIATLGDKFKDGDMFKYLGVDCKVVRTKRLFSSLHISFYYAELQADYVDRNGVIHLLTLSYEEAMRIEI